MEEVLASALRHQRRNVLMLEELRKQARLLLAIRASCMASTMPCRGASPFD